MKIPHLLRGRKIELRFTKDEPPQPALDAAPVAPTDYSAIANRTIEVTAGAIITGILVYMGADTLRQVIIKSTPTR